MRLEGAPSASALAVRLRADRIGLIAPGLPSWAEAQPVLRGRADYRADPVGKPSPARVPARERRRMTSTIAFAIAAADEALGADGTATELSTVFACSGGDTEVIDRICRALLDPEKPVSPGDFHHSVHNAPGGYWSIATGDRASTVSLSAYDGSFAAGLLEAATQLAAGAGRVLLVAYDTPAPDPIWRFRPLVAPFATALVLVPGRGPFVPGDLHLLLELGPARGAETSLEDGELERLRRGNPAARALPLLCKLAREEGGSVSLPYLHGRHLTATLRPAGTGERR